MRCNRKGNPYIDGRKRREPYTLAVFDNWSTAATQTHETVLALMHTHLTAPDDQRAVPHAGDVRRAAGSAAYQQAFGHGVDG